MSWWLPIIYLILTGLGGCSQDTSKERVEPTVAENSPQRETQVDASVSASAQRQQGAKRSELVSQAARHFSRGEFESARKLLREHLVEQPTDSQALELVGDVASRQGKLVQAIEFYREAATCTEQPSLNLFDKWAKNHMASGAAFDAVDVLQLATKQYPDVPKLRYDLAGLAAMLGLNDVMNEPLRWLVRHDLGDAESLAALSIPTRSEADPDTCRELLTRKPGDLRPHYGIAKLDADHFRWQAVVDRLAPVAKRHDDCIHVNLLYGRALLELQIANPTDARTSELEAAANWARNHLEDAGQNASYWINAGLLQRLNQDAESAAASFAKAVDLENGDNAYTLSQLAISLKNAGRGDELQQVSGRLRAIGSLQDAVTSFHERHSRSQLAAIKIAYQLVDLGRLWESYGWAKLALSLPDDPVEKIMQANQAIRARLHQNLPWQSPDAKLSLSLRIDTPESLSWEVAKRSAERTTGPDDSVAIHFRDIASAWGLNHEVALAPETATAGHWIHQSVGGGSGAIDIDLDGLPDVALANLDGQARQQDSTANQLYRNLSGKFINVTKPSGYSDHGFAQGIAVADFNNDGWPDIFDCNIGLNRLYQNNGDGTFSDVSSAVGLQNEGWTTSAVVTDLNADGYADVFEVNYCAGSRPMEKPCRSESTGLLSSCPPLQFEAEGDRVWIGTATGKLVDASKTLLRSDQPGRGLGIVAGHFDEKDGLDVYVANDMSVNHFWSASDGESGVNFSEQAAARGLATSGQSRSQASMGMAVGDPDGDGDIDFFLTHFAEEHNTFYEQVAAGIWQDRSNAVGLFEPSFLRLGFGSQWADFDNDRDLELVVSNGHVSDTGRQEIGYEMEPQLFTRQTSGQWSQVNSSSLGDYFSKKHLGRALLTLDVNRDRLADVLVTHLYEPVALLLNETDDAGMGVTLRLTATSSHRDAVGTTVEAIVDGKQRTYQLTTGDGYMCSNERCLFIGAGKREKIDQLRVRWPSGNLQVFGPLDVAAEYRLVEGHEKAWRMLGDE